MVGKGVGPNSSRIFQQCYVKCCKIQNLTPLNNVIPTNNGKVVDFCVDRIKYADWPPILNALCCDLSLHSVSIRCRQQVKTVLEHIDCERLAKSVNKRAVILTNFMMSNLVEAVSQLLSNTTLLTTLLLEGLPLKIPYLNPLCEAISANSSLQHLFLPRCLIGDAGCLAICKAVRCLPNILTLDLSGCELTLAGAGYIAELVKYQKIHRYSENWVHTLRYRLPELDAMAGLRRITLCGNPLLGDAGVGKLLGVLADDLWIKGLDVQNCGLTDRCASVALQVLRSNTTLVILDMRHNAEVSNESLSEIRAALRNNEQRPGEQLGQYSWISSISGSTSESKLIKSVSRTDKMKSRVLSNTRSASNRYVKSNVTKNEKDYTEELEEQLQEEISHRQKLEELNLQLVDQMKQLKQQQQRLWANGANSSGSEQSLQVSSRSYDMSSSSGSTSSVPIDQNTLSYIQQAFKDIYAFIKNNQCKGQCLDNTNHERETVEYIGGTVEYIEVNKRTSVEENEVKDFRMNITPKKAQSAHLKLFENVKTNKTTKSAHLLNGTQISTNGEARLEVLERNIGDTIGIYENEKNIKDSISLSKDKENSEKFSPCGSVVSDSSETLVCTPTHTQRSRNAITINPLDAFYSSDEDSS